MKSTLTKYSSFEELKAPRTEKVPLKIRKKRANAAKKFIEELRKIIK
jgi:hypothetical protein